MVSLENRDRVKHLAQVESLSRGVPSKAGSMWWTVFQLLNANTRAFTFW